MEPPLISVLMPFKNTAAYLPECLDSLLAQDIDSWELLAVDDGSTDSSREILGRYAQNDARISVLVNEGSGIIPALRLAYSKANGKLITRMDSDDIMPPQKLRTLSEKLLASGEGHISIGQVKYFSKAGISDGYNRYERWINQLTAEGKNFGEIYKECVIPSPCWMTYREDLERCGAFEPDRYPEDYDLSFRFYAGQLRPIPCGEVLHFWRDYPERTSRNSEHYAQNYFLDIKMTYFLKLDYLENRPLVVWGAGYKGKTIAQKLIAADIPFMWLCDNPKKIGKRIYGQSMEHYSAIDRLQRPQSIITVANETAQTEIRSFFKARGSAPMEDFYFFC